MKKKNYAVKNGRKKGIYDSWEACRMQVHGYPNAAFKGFGSVEQAKSFLEETALDSEDFETSAELGYSAKAYVDGSYDHRQPAFSYGVVFFWENNTDYLWEKLDAPALLEMRNVAGEIAGAKRAMEYCIEHQIKSLTLYHDYEGIAKWCTGEWKTNKDGTRDYKAYYDRIKGQLYVTFIKVAGHSNDRYNDLADQLAKHALGLAELPDSIPQRSEEAER